MEAIVLWLTTFFIIFSKLERKSYSLGITREMLTEFKFLRELLYCIIHLKSLVQITRTNKYFCIKDVSIIHTAGHICLVIYCRFLRRSFNKENCLLITVRVCLTLGQFRQNVTSITQRVTSRTLKLPFIETLQGKLIFPVSTAYSICPHEYAPHI